MFQSIERLLKQEGWEPILGLFPKILNMARFIADNDPFIININYTTKFLFLNIFHNVYWNYYPNSFIRWVNNTGFGRQDSLNEDDRLLLTLHVLHSLCLCKYISSMVSSRVCTLLPRVTPFGKCFTHYFNEDKIKISFENDLNMFQLNNFDQVYGTQLFYPYSSKRIIFHSVNTGPELTSDEISINSYGYDNYLITLTRFDIRQLLNANHNCI